MASGTGRQNRRGAGRWWWLVGRLLLVGTLLAGIGILILNRTAPETARQVRSNATDWAAPILDVVTAPVRGASAVVDWVSSFFSRGAHVRRLETENMRLKLVSERSAELARQHQQLRSLLKVVEPKAGLVRTARIVGASSASYLQSAVITAGARHGVRANQPIRDEAGLVGQVIEVGRWSSRVLLITDSQSRIPVRNLRTGQMGYAAGQNASLMLITMAEPGSEVSPKDVFVTSGEGGIFPPGIPVGTVVAILQGEPQLKSAAHLRQLSYALILRPYVPDVVQPLSVDVLAAGEAVENTPPAP
jgi:rod shape-determining protein MreC